MSSKSLEDKFGRHSPLKLAGRLHLAILTLVYGFGATRIADFGVGWDEYAVRAHGIYNLVGIVRFISPSLVPTKYSYFPTLDEWYAFDHGAWFEILLAAVEAITKMEHLHDIYIMRHFLTYSFCAFGLLNFYFLLKRLEFKSFVVWITVAMAILSPRTLADSYNNSKDMVFLSLIAIGMNTFSAYISQTRLGLLLSFSIICGLSIGHRIVAGLLIPIVSFFLVFYEWHVLKKDFGNTCKKVLMFVFVSILVFVTSMPYLWKNPVKRIPEVIFSNMDFPWHGYLLFDGKIISAQNVPSSYLFHWIVITTPLLYLLLCVVGLIFTFNALLSKPGFNSKNLRIVALFPHLFFIFFVLFLYLTLRPTVYDGWRHFYFIYPAILIFTAYGLEKIMELLMQRNSLLKLTAFSLLFSNLLTTFVWMIDAHPMYNLYFNRVAGLQPVERWEMDYWGVGNVLALRWILKNEESWRFSVAAISSTPLSHSTDLLTEDEIDRIEFEQDFLSLPLEEVLKNKPDYLINNFRGVGIPTLNKRLNGYTIVHSLAVKNQIFIQIYRRNLK